MTSESLPSSGVQCGEVIWNGGISIQRRPIVIQDNVSLFSKLSSQLSSHAFFDDAIRTANAVTIRARLAVATSNDHQDCCCECKAYAEPCLPGARVSDENIADVFITSRCCIILSSSPSLSVSPHPHSPPLPANSSATTQPSARFPPVVQVFADRPAIAVGTLVLCSLLMGDIYASVRSWDRSRLSIRVQGD